MQQEKTKNGEHTHRDLCLKASKYLKNKGIKKNSKCSYVVCELERIGESPDAFGWSINSTQLIEVKVSRSDFLSDKKKFWRKFPDKGIGKYRSYLCPEGLIKETDLPKYWGLLFINDNGKISEIVKPEPQINNTTEEICLISSILRREGILPKIFSYKNYKNGEK